MAYNENVPISAQPQNTPAAINALAKPKPLWMMRKAIDVLKKDYASVADKADGTQDGKVNQTTVIKLIDQAILSPKKPDHLPYLIAMRVVIASFPQGVYSIEELGAKVDECFSSMCRGKDKDITPKKLQEFYEKSNPVSQQSASVVITGSDVQQETPKPTPQPLASSESATAVPVKAPTAGPKMVVQPIADSSVGELPSASPTAENATPSSAESVSYTTKQLQLYELAKALGKEEFTKRYGVDSISKIDNLPLPPLFKSEGKSVESSR